MSESTPMPNTSLEISKASINVALTKAGYNYQKLLQDVENIAFTPDNLATAGAPIAVLRKAKTALDKLENPHTAAWQAWNQARKSIMDPIDEAITRKTGECTAINDKVKAEIKRIEDEKNRKAGIKVAITNFTVAYSTKIASATTNDELIALQKLLGAEKSRKNFYQEFLPDLCDAVEGLEEAMRKQKLHIKELNLLQVQKKAAETSGDDEKLVELLDKEEAITEKIEDTKAAVQEAAINQSTAFVATEAEVILPQAAKPRLTTWEWRIVDMYLFQRAHPELVEISAKKSGIDAILTQRRKDKTIKAIVENGLEIYQKEHL